MNSNRLTTLSYSILLGPIIAIANAFNKKEVMGMTFMGWTINYILISAIQVILAIIYTIMLKISF